MNSLRAVALPTVRKEAIEFALISQDLTWEGVNHCTATASLGNAIGKFGSVGVPVATLIDLVIFAGLDDRFRIEWDAYPEVGLYATTGQSEFGRQESKWHQLVAGRRMRVAIEFDDLLRRFLRDRNSDEQISRVLLGGRRELRHTLEVLASAGVGPDDIEPGDSVEGVARDFWKFADSELPFVGAARRDLWIPTEQFVAQDSEHAIDLRRRLRGTLDRAFGPIDDRRTIVHHGFYFYTAPQWAFFQLLRQLPEVDQLFIVHDDGVNPCFESWRKYFHAGWQMPVPEFLPMGSQGTAQSDALLQALNGQPVQIDFAAGSLEIIDFRSPAEFVRHVQFERNRALESEGPTSVWRPFAADADTVMRYLKRLGREVDSDSVDLAQLPVGAFLLAIHDCIKGSDGGPPHIELTAEGILDLATSGFLIGERQNGHFALRLASLRRALPFFRGCIHPNDWLERAEEFKRATGKVGSGVNRREQDASDVDRIAYAAGNPIRLVPWADLSLAEIDFVVSVIRKVLNLVQGIASKERVALADHVAFLRPHLAQGMKALSAGERASIESKIDGFSVGLESTIDVDGLIDVVKMLLGRSTNFAPQDSAMNLSDPVAKMRSLDVLGLIPLDSHVHVANLAEGSFPGPAAKVGWPFKLKDVRAEPISVELLTARYDNAGLADLYLFWLAMDGVVPGRKVTLSWISEVAGELRNPSSVISLLARIGVKSQEIQTRAGGVEITRGISAADEPPRTTRPEPREVQMTQTQLRAALEQVDNLAVASAMACPRRFAIQWAFGPSASFMAEHHQATLYGNVIGAIVRLGLMSEADANSNCDALWRNHTEGERASSLANRRIHPKGKSAAPAWVFTLAGVKNRTDPLDLAYQAASDKTCVDSAVVAPDSSTFLPHGSGDVAICERCPVKPRCAVWLTE